MDNLTHSLIGLAAAKAGLERLSPMATTVCVLAANAPDADILATLGGRWFYLHHHRGITHSIVGTFVLALFIPTLFYLIDLIIARIRKREKRVKFGGLLLCSLILSASHPLMDWMNNYGVRPLLPWDRTWYYGDLVFIVDPWIWLLAGGAAFLLSSRFVYQKVAWAALALLLTGLILFVRLENSGLQHPNVFRGLWIAALFALILTRWATPLVKRWGNRVAIAALALVVVYWCSLAVVHRAALSQAERVAQQLSVQNGERLGRVAAMPSLADPTRWQCVADTDRSTYRFFVSLTGGAEGEAKRFVKPQGRDVEVIAQASQDERARIFLDWARFPAGQVSGDCLSGLLVQFADLRYTEPNPSGRGTFSLNVPVACDAGEAEEQK